MLFFPAIIRMQKSYARDLLTHVNPYTGASYADEPSVAFVELNNEDGLMHEWWTGSLDGMPGVYADELTRQWRAWLDQQYPTTSAFRQAWGMADQPAGAEMLAPLSSASAWTLQVSPGAKATDAFSPVGPDKAAARVVQVLTPGGRHGTCRCTRPVLPWARTRCIRCPCGPRPAQRPPSSST